MRLVIQRVSKASVTIENKLFSSINKGLLVLVGVEENDTAEDVEWLSAKVANMRIFPDAEGKINLSVKEISGEILIVSQFTLHASTKKGNRPSFLAAARPDKAIPLYELMIKKLSEEMGIPCKTGEFGADMKVELVNDGPVTVLIDSKMKE